MRYSPEDEALAHNFVEYSDSWTRGETKTAYNKVGSEFLDLLKRKITAIHLDCLEGEPITDAAALTEDDLDRIDVRVYTWFSMTWVAHLNNLADLGNALGRKLFALSATSKEAMTDALHLQRN